MRKQFIFLLMVFFVMNFLSGCSDPSASRAAYEYDLAYMKAKYDKVREMSTEKWYSERIEGQIIGGLTGGMNTFTREIMIWALIAKLRSMHSDW